MGEFIKQDGQLAPAYFSPNYKYFDQLLQTVKKNNCFDISFEEFLQTSIRPLISVLYAKGITNFHWKISVSQCRKISSRNLSVFQKISGTEKC